MVDDEVYYLLWDGARHLSFRWGAKGKYIDELGFPKRSESSLKWAERPPGGTNLQKPIEEQLRDGSGMWET